MARHSTIIISLMAVALALLLLSTAVGFHKLNKAFNLITGAPSFSLGETNITVTSVTSLSLIGGNGTVVSFGSGFVNASCNWCQMDSNGINVSGYSNGSNLSTTGTPSIAPCCVSFTVPVAGFLIENTGNANLSVGYTCSGNCTFTSYLGGARTGYISGGLEIKVTANSVAAQSGEEGVLDTSQSCLGGGATFRTSNWNITNASAYNSCPGAGADLGMINGNCTGIPAARYTPLSSIGHYLCGNSSGYPLDSANANDAAVIDVNLTILADAPATGVRSSFRLTFNGTASG